MKRQFRWPWRSAADIRSEIDDEIRFHLDMRSAQLIKEGMDPKEARDKAQHEFGDLDEARRALRRADLRNESRRRTAESLLELAQDFRYAARALRRSRVYGLMAIVTLALGIAATTVVFSFVDGVLLRPLPFKEPSRLINVGGFDSPPDFVDAREVTKDVALLAAYNPDAVVLTTDVSSERVQAVRVTPGFFEALSATPAMGRVIADQDAVDGQDRFAVLSDNIWRNRFAADPGLVGKSIRIEGENYTVIGVMPASFAFPAPARLWLPKSFSTHDLTTQRGARYLNVLGRLQSGSDIRMVESRLKALRARLATQFPRTSTGIPMRVGELKESIVGDYRRALLVLMASGACLLLIACANIAGLTLVRTLDRSHELALRSALGAGRWRIARALLTESAVVAALGGALGIFLAMWGIEAMVALEASRIPRIAEVRLDVRTLAFAVGITTLSALAFGLAPALRAIRLAAALKRFRSRGRMQGALVAAEVALTLILLSGAGLLLRTFQNLQHTDSGFTPGNVLTFELALPKALYPEPGNARDFYRQLLTRVRSLPGVTAAGSVSGVPFTDYDYRIYVSKLDGRPASDGGQHDRFVEFRVASPDYFRAMGIRLVRGRSIEEADREGSPDAVVIAESAARLLWPGQDPIGHTIDLGTNLGLGPDHAGGQVVGIVGDYYDLGVRRPLPPLMFVSHAQFPIADQMIAIQSRGDPKGLVESIRNELRKLDPELPMAGIRHFRDVAREAIADDRSYASLVGVYAALALALAAVGIYGITAYAVSQRTREFGVRLALGATPSGILRNVLNRSFRLVAVGVAAGMVCTLALTQSLQKMLFALSPDDPATLLSVAAGLLAVSLIASWLPARRAEKLDPMTALRDE